MSGAKNTSAYKIGCAVVSSKNSSQYIVNGGREQVKDFTGQRMEWRRIHKVRLLRNFLTAPEVTSQLGLSEVDLST